MKTTAELLSATMRTIPAGSTNSRKCAQASVNNTFSSLSDEEQAQVVNHLFKMLKRTFTGQFLKYEKEVEGWLSFQKKQLVRDEAFSQLTKGQIKSGIDKACNGQYLPNVGQLVQQRRIVG